MSARSAECRCDDRFTCGFCLRNAKPYFYTPRSAAETAAAPACTHASAVTKTYTGSEDTYRWCGDCFTIVEGAEPGAAALIDAAARADVTEANEEDYTRPRALVPCLGRMDHGVPTARCCVCRCKHYELNEGDRCPCSHAEVSP